MNTIIEAFNESGCGRPLNHPNYLFASKVVETILGNAHFFPDCATVHKFKIHNGMLGGVWYGTTEEPSGQPHQTL